MSNGEKLVTVHWRHDTGDEDDTEDEDDDDDAEAELTHWQVSLMNGRICHKTLSTKLLTEKVVSLFLDVGNSIQMRPI